jgi:hypothetical protein
MYYFTGDLVPTSILSRSIRFSDINFIHSFISIFKSHPYIIIQILTLLLSIKLFKKENYLIKFSILSGLAGLFILFFSKSFSIRYFEVFVLFSMPASIRLINRYYDFGINKISLLPIIFLIFFFKVSNPSYSKNSNLENRLSKSFSLKINKLIPKDSKILMYEIQSQYFINSQVISLDGRVGDECFDLLKGKTNLVQTMKTNKIDYISIDENISSLLMKDYFIKSLYDNRTNLDRGDTIKIKSHKFLKVFSSEDSPEEYKMYGDIFKLINNNS